MAQGKSAKKTQTAKKLLGSGAARKAADAIEKRRNQTSSIDKRLARMQGKK